MYGNPTYNEMNERINFAYRMTARRFVAKACIGCKTRRGFKRTMHVVFISLQKNQIKSNYYCFCYVCFARGCCWGEN